MEAPNPSIASSASAAAPATLPADPLAALPKLGVGLSFQGSLEGFVRERLPELDFLEVIPDSFWIAEARGTPDRYRENPKFAGLFAEVAARKPIVCHSIGLSIGSADHFDREHVAQIAGWRERHGCPWHSDHLAYNRLDHATGPTVDLGVTLPVPYDEGVLEMLIERVRHVQAVVPVPFLLENNVYYFKIPNQDMAEAEFLNRLTAVTGCGLLLDLHNVYTNATNHGFDPWDFLGDLDLTRVVEIHLGGGSTIDGVYVDSHAGPTPDPVLDLFAEVLPEVPNLCGVVFEVFGSAYPLMGAARLSQEIATIRRVLGWG